MLTKISWPLLSWHNILILLINNNELTKQNNKTESLTSRVPLTKISWPLLSWQTELTLTLTNLISWPLVSWQNQITEQKICSPWGHGRSLHGEHECGHVGLVESDRVAKLTKKVYLNCVDQNYLTTTMLTEWRNLNRISWPLVSWQNDITKPKLRSPWRCGWPSHEERELGHVGRVGADRVVRLTKMVYLNCVDQN